MQRYVKKLGYFGFAGVVLEAVCRVPSKPAPDNEYADAVWENDLPKQLQGKTFIITGSSRGMGFDLAKRIAARGGNLLLLNRTGSHAESARVEVEKAANAAGGAVVLINCDLCDFESVRSAAADVRKQLTSKGWKLNCLVLNAGLMAQNDVRTKDGYDIQMQANHLSHFLLSELLFDLLEKTAQDGGDARIVSHSSGARNSPDSPLREDAFEKSWANTAGTPNPCVGDAKAMPKWQRYQQSKRANLAFTYALADFINGRANCGVKAVCAHPGASNTGLQSRTAAASWLDNFINGLAACAGHSTSDGALGLALGTLKEGVANGDFFGPVDITGNAVLLRSEREAKYDPQQLRMLWEKSEVATGAQWSRL